MIPPYLRSRVEASVQVEYANWIRYEAYFAGAVVCRAAFSASALFASWRPMTQPAAAPTLPCPATDPATPPTMAPLMHPLAWAAEENASPRTAVQMRSLFMAFLPNEFSAG